MMVLGEPRVTCSTFVSNISTTKVTLKEAKNSPDKGVKKKNHHHS